jgi:hypothetical protein
MTAYFVLFGKLFAQASHDGLASANQDSEAEQESGQKPQQPEQGHRRNR